MNTQPGLRNRALARQKTARLAKDRQRRIVFDNPVVPSHDRIAEVPRHPVEGGWKLTAAWMIEACGIEGYRHGGDGFTEAHALVLVNHGGVR